jgi:hypothetical protein
MEARRRIIPALLGLAGFVALGSQVGGRFWDQWWFYVGVATAISVVFIEPFFTRPQDGLINAVAAITAFATAPHGAILGLWILYLVFALLVTTASLFAILTPPHVGRPKALANWVSRQFGRAIYLGGMALLLEVVREASQQTRGFDLLGYGVAALLGGLVIAGDVRLLGALLHQRTSVGEAVAASGPSMLLVSSQDLSLPDGAAVVVAGRGGSCPGSVVARLSHKDGLRYQIALQHEWTSVCTSFPQAIQLTRSSEVDRIVVGAASAGSTELALHFQPAVNLHVGDAVALVRNTDDLLYQLTDLRLQSSDWAGASVLRSHAVARLIGVPAHGYLTASPQLPSPHEPVFASRAITGQLPDDFAQLGSLKGTSVPIGITVDPAGRGHFAIVGMSGMGKTCVARRLAEALSVNSMVVALDTTGEYRTRLNLPSWSEGTNESPCVMEPRGDPPQQARTFIERVMTLSAAEYESGTVTPRVILLEEAHGFIPEWNFATRTQTDHVAFSTRLIMQSRKFSVTFVIISQRTAVVSKSGISQCENYIVLRTIDKTSVEYMEGVVGAEMCEAIPRLAKYEAVCFGPAFNADTPVIVSLLPPP